MPAILSIENHSRAQFYLIIIILSGIAGTLLLAIIVLVLIRSQILSRKKLYNLSHPDTEASKDYQVCSFLFVLIVIVGVNFF